jgi:tetratricopeptide (TPR) repeat protein
LWEEYANTLDNTGRVYTLMYERSRAESLIDNGLELRRKQGRDYRIALSLISRAVTHLTFDEPHRARRLCEEALNICEQVGVQRGIGLALIPLGQTLRKLGALGTVNLYPPEAADNFFRDAIGHLNRAVTIFETKVNEPVRLVEAYNELGCTCRDRAILARSIEPRSPLARSILRDAVQHLTKSIELAEKQQSSIMYVDACEDLAQAYFQREDYHYVDLWLERAAGHIPDQYKVQEGIGLVDIPAAECVEEFWQLLGKIELLQGFRVYDTALATNGGKISTEVLAQAVHHFVFAAAYFERYSEKAPGLEKTFKQLYNRFKLCRYEDLRYIQDELLPEIAEKYNLNRAQLGKFFEDTLGLAMQL